MDVINTGKHWIVNKIMSYMNKYFTGFSFEDIELALLRGKCNFDYLKLNVKVLEQEFDLPFHVISGHVLNLKIQFPWYKLLTNVVINAETIEIDIKMKEINQKYEKKNTKKEDNLESEEETTLSYTESYIKKLINTLIENVLISCSNIILKLIEDGIVIRVDIKLFTLCPNKDDWAVNIVRVKSSTQFTLNKMGDIVRLTISINKTNKSGFTENYLEPLVFNEPLSIRLLCIFQTFNSSHPYFIQLDMFTSKIQITLMESHMLIIKELFNFIKKYNSAYNIEKNDDNKRCNIIPQNSISEPISTKESWMDWINTLIPSSNNQKTISYEILNIGIYINTMIILFNFEMEKSLNTYKPLIKMTCNGLMFKIVHNSLNSKKIKFGISKIMINSEKFCTCGFKDCFNNQKLHFSSGQLQDDYLFKSLFQQHLSSDEHILISPDDINKEMTPSKKTFFIKCTYINYQRPIEKRIVIIDVGTCVINLTIGLIHRLQFILRFLSRHELSLLISKTNSDSEEEHNPFDESNGVCYDFKISSIVMKILPTCHVPSNTNTRRYPILDKIPEVLITVHTLQGSIVIPKNAALWSKISIHEIVKENEVLSIMKFNVNKLKVDVFKSNTTHTLLRIYKIEWKKIKHYCLENKSDYLLNINSIKFHSSKENYLLFYYIVYSMIIKTQCNQLYYINNCIFNKKLLQNNSNSVVLEWEIDDINFHNIYQNGTSNFEITLRNMSAEIFILKNINNKLWSKILSTVLNDGMEDSPMLHIIIQIQSNTDVTQMPLIYVKVTEISINIDPLFFEWLIYVPESTTEKGQNTLDSIEFQENITFNSSIKTQLKNESKKFQIWNWFDKWKSTPVFVDFSTILLYFPNAIAPCLKTTITNYEKINVNKWIQLIIDHDIDVVVINISNTTLHCALNRQKVESFFDNFPVVFPDSIWSNDISLFPWKINLEQLKCCIINKKCDIHPSINEIKLLDTFDIICLFMITSTTDNCKNEIYFNGSLNCSIIEPINIYVSELQVVIFGRLLKNLIDVLKIFSEVDCTNSEIESNENVEDNKIYLPVNFETITIFKNLMKQKTTSDNIVESCSNTNNENTLNVENELMEKVENNLLNQNLMEISITLNCITINLFKNEIIDKFEPLMYICMSQPNFFLLLTEISDSYQIVLSNLNIWVTTNENAIKSELPNSDDYSISFFETNSVKNRDDDLDQPLLTILISYANYPKIQIKLNRNIQLSMHKVILNTLFKITNMFNKQNKYKHIRFDDNLSDYGVYNYSLNKNTFLKLHEIVNDSISYQKVFNRLKWIIYIEFQQLILQLLTETEDKIMLNVENIHWQLKCMGGKKSEQMNGELTLNNVTISLVYIDTNDLLLYPTPIVIKTTSYLSKTKSLKLVNDINVTIHYASLYLSRKHCEIVLLVWNTYKKLFDTKNNNIEKQECQNKNIFYHDDFGTDNFTIIKNNDSDIPLPYQIKLSNNLSKQIKITWTYPQLRRLTKIVIQSEFIYPKNGMKVELYWYNKTQKHFHCCYTCLLCPKHKQILPTFEQGKGISNTWQIVINNEDLQFTISKLQKFISYIKVQSYFSPNFVPFLQMSMTILLSEIYFLHDVQKPIFLTKYHCVSEELVKHQLLCLQLDKIRIHINFHKKEIITSVVITNTNLKLLLNEYLKEISVIEMLLNFTSFHTSHPMVNNQYNIETGVIKCQIGPKTVSSLIATMNLWFNSSCDIVPYIICNYTCNTIIFSQTNTDENIVLNSLDYYNYSWRISTENPKLKFAIKDEEDMLYWSEEIIVHHAEDKKCFSIKGYNEQIIILIATIQPISPVSVKIVITSTVKLMNKTEYSLDLDITEIQNNPDQQNPRRKYILTVNPFEVTPSFMFNQNSEFSMALRFSTSETESQWSDRINYKPYNITDNDKIEKNKKCTLIKIPKKEIIETLSCVMCHFILEINNEIPQILILLLPTFMIHSYSPDDIKLDLNIISNKYTYDKNVIKVKSAVKQKNIQQIDLPVLLYDDDSDYDLVLSLNEKVAFQPVESISSSCSIKSINETLKFSIEEHLNNQYISTKTNFKWPFVGNQFDRVQWKSGILHDVDNVKTTLRIQNYANVDLGVSTRLISIYPWALIVNTTGQLISVHSSTNIICTLKNMSVVAPPDINEKLFYIEIGIGSGHRSAPLKVIHNQHSDYQEDGLIQLDMQNIIFQNGTNSMAYLSVRSSGYKNMNIIHVQSSYVVTNRSSIDLDMLAVCSIPNSNLINVPNYSSNSFVNLPKTSKSLGKPLALWTLMESSCFLTDKLDQYVIIASNGNLSCPIKLSDIKSEEQPVVFSSSERVNANQLICVTLTKLETLQYVITISDQPYAQLAFYNYCSTTIIVTHDSKCEEPIRFLDDCSWNWPYRIMPKKNSYLSFPHSKIHNNCAMTMYFVTVMTEKSYTSWFANIKVNNSECVALFAEFDQEIEIKISRKAFTWEVVFYPTYYIYNNAANTMSISVAHKEKSQNFIKCYINSFKLSLLVDEFNLKEILRITLNKIVTTLQPTKVKVINEEIQFVISIDTVQISNQMCSNDDNFDFPIILNMRQRQNKRKNQFMKYASKEKNQTNSAITIMLAIDKSSYSTPVILDLEVSLSTLEVLIEDRFICYLLKYLKNCNVVLPKVEVHDYVSEELIPINVWTQTFSNRMDFRILKIIPFQLVLNLHWSYYCFISLNRLRIRLTKLKNININASPRQITKYVSIHYYNDLINNVGNVITSLELIGAPGNSLYMIKKGLHDLTSITVQGFTQGPIGLVFGLAKGSMSLIKHLLLGMLMTISSFTTSWSRTFYNFKCLKYITYPIIKMLNIVETTSKFCIDYIMYTIVDNTND